MFLMTFCFIRLLVWSTELYSFPDGFTVFKTSKYSSSSGHWKCWSLFKLNFLFSNRERVVITDIYKTDTENKGETKGPK